MTSTLILGDIHAGHGLSSMGKPGLGSALNSRVIDQFKILEWVLNQALENNCGDIILTGDIFDDTKPPSYLVSLFIDWLKQCASNSIIVHINAGNHDLNRSGQFYQSPLDIISSAELEGVFVYKEIGSFERAGIAFTIVPFRDRRSFNTNSNSEALKLLRNKIKYECLGLSNLDTKVLVGHLALEGSIHVGEIGDMVNELWTPLDLYNGYDFVWHGHIHSFQVMRKSPNYIAHLGSMDLSNFGECNQKKYIAIIDTKTNPIYKYVEIPVRPLKQISVSIPKDTTDTTEFVLKFLEEEKPDVKKAIIKMHITLESPEMFNADKIAIENKLIEMGAFYAPRIDQERKVSQIKKNIMTDNLDNAVNEATAIKMYAEAVVEDTIRDDFITLANSIVKEAINATN